MKAFRSVVFVFSLTLYAYSTSAQTWTQTINTKLTTIPSLSGQFYGYKTALNISKDGSVGFIDLNKHIDHGTDKATFTLTMIKSLELGVNEKSLDPYSLHPLIEWNDPDNRAKASLAIQVLETNSDHQLMTIRTDGVDLSSAQLEITTIAGEKVKFDAAKVIFKPDTKALEIELSVEKGFYTFKLTSGTQVISETHQVTW